MIGIGVGIDYALFIVTRYRAALHRTGSPEAAVHRSDEHLGSRRRLRRVHRDDLGARHVPDGPELPARSRRRDVARGLRSRCSPRSRCCPRCSASSASRSTGCTSGGARRAAGGHVAPLGALRAAPPGRRSRSPGSRLLVVVALPAFRLRLGSADASNDPTSSTTHQAYDLIAEGFGPGANGPILVVADTTAAGQPQPRSRVSSTRCAPRPTCSRSATCSPTHRALPRSRR